eukprot:UN30679
MKQAAQTTKDNNDVNGLTLIIESLLQKKDYDEMNDLMYSLASIKYDFSDLLSTSLTNKNTEVLHFTLNWLNLYNQLSDELLDNLLQQTFQISDKNHADSLIPTILPFYSDINKLDSELLLPLFQHTFHDTSVFESVIKNHPSLPSLWSAITISNEDLENNVVMKILDVCKDYIEKDDYLLLLQTLLSRALYTKDYTTSVHTINTLLKENTNIETMFDLPNETKLINWLCDSVTKNKDHINVSKIVTLFGDKYNDICGDFVNNYLEEQTTNNEEKLEI